MGDVDVHEIAFKGFAGITYILIMWALVFYILAFASPAWTDTDLDVNIIGTGIQTDSFGIGMWQQCFCADTDTNSKISVN